MMKRITGTRARIGGFSLMELLAVMSIMALLTTLSVTSYFGAVRSMTRRGAVKNLAETLKLARQRACMENARISVLLFNEITGEKDTDVTPSYVLCREVGRVSFVRTGWLIDEFSEIDKIFGTTKFGDEYKGSLRLYNLKTGKWSEVYPWVEEYELAAHRSASGNPWMTAAERNSGYRLNAFGFRINERVRNQNEADWNVGEAYGIEAAPISNLPDGFQFDNLQKRTDKAICFIFNPDGTAENKGGSTVTLRETVPPKTSAKVSVSSDGDIRYDQRWQ